MKKSILISIFTFALLALSCSKVYDISEVQIQENFKSKEEIDKEAAYYATVIRNIIRFDAINESFTLEEFSKGRIGGNDKQSIINSKVNEAFESMRKEKGEVFFENAKKMYSHPLLSSSVSLTPMKVFSGEKKKDLGNKTVEIPKYLHQYVGDFQKHVIDKIGKYSERIEKKNDVNLLEFTSLVKNTVSDFEDRVIKDKKLTQEQRAEIFSMTSVCYANAETICKVSTSALEEVTNTKGMRVKGFIRSLIRIVSTIIYSVVAATIAGVLIGALIGVPDIGGALGAVVGLVWGIVDVVQGDCTCWDIDCDPDTGNCSLYNFYSCPC